uniref:ATP synthase, H+ transporting, mitochondrial F0 complex, subunit g n=1 Tax=Eptatretus burgeri TaxID=7764 RepID=A0A8C4QPT8_EPTBU
MLLYLTKPTCKPRVALWLIFVAKFAVVPPAGAVSFCRPHLITFWSLARVELTPPRISEVRPAVEMLRGEVKAAKLGHYKQLTVREAVRGGLVAVEVAMWFFVGEVIGRGSLVGYNV